MNDTSAISREIVEDVQLEVQNLKRAIETIQARNERVELDKRWETSMTRFVSVSLITYLVMNLLLWTIGGPFPPLHAIVPTCGYMLSTLSLRTMKRWWISRHM